MATVKSTMHPEQQLLDMLYRLEGMLEETTALHVKLSLLKPGNKTAHQIRLTASALETIIASSRSRMFLLSDTDIVLIGREINKEHLKKTIQDIKGFFLSDPLLAKNSHASFIDVYNLKKEYQDFLQIALEKEEIYKSLNTQEDVSIPIGPEHLDAILRNIEGFDILNVIRRQEAIEITRSGRYCSLFFEYFTSMADLKTAIAPNINMFSNRWLFQHLSETLDKRMLSAHKELFEHTPGNISLNLNISTIFTSTFTDFLISFPKDATLVVEVQLMDIIQNTKNYIIAKDLLREAGHKILIDGLHPISFQFMDLNLLDPDLLKLNWSLSILDDEKNTPLPQLIQEINPNRIVLMRSESEEAIKWGLSNGISRFQGYYLDALSGAGIKRKCTQSENCTLSQCIARKSCIAGPLRDQCPYGESLDSPIQDNL